MSILYLVRHAHADWTPDEARPLSPQGGRDALAVAQMLAEFPITVIYASAARRAQETVAPLASRLNLPVGICEEFRERKLAAGPVDDFLGAVRATWEDPHRALPGGESNAAAQRRGVAALRGLVARHPAAHIVVATHGNLLALILQHVYPRVGFDFWHSMSMPDVYQMAVGPAGDCNVERLWKIA